MSATTDILDRDTLGAFCRHTHVTLEGAPAGPLSGTTCGVKDLYHIAGHRTGFGNPTWFETHPAAESTAVSVQRLLAAGARMVGKTHTDELAYSLNGENRHYGTPVNTDAPGRIPGGSSNGSAAAVAGGLVDFALGSDTGGSVRIPASYCGVLGMRVTHGAIPLAGATDFAPSFDTAGWFARDAALFERVGRVLLADAAPARSPRRLLIGADAFRQAGPDAAAALAPAIARLEALLGPGEQIDVADVGLDAWMQDFRVIQAFEIWSTHREWVSGLHPDFGAGIRERFVWASTLTAEAAAAASAARRPQNSSSGETAASAFCASRATPTCRRSACRSPRRTGVRSGSRCSPRAATIRCYSNWPGISMRSDTDATGAGPNATRSDGAIAGF